MRFYFLVIILFSGVIAIAQKQKKEPRVVSVMQLGGAATYFLGSQTDVVTYQKEKLGWQVDALLGLAFKPKPKAARNVLAAFGTYGAMSPSSLSTLFTNQNLSISLSDRQSFEYYQLEGGVLIGEVLRISTGGGYQQLINSDEEKQNIYYMSSTAGFHINLGTVDWVINCNVLHGREFTTSVFRLTTGLMIKF